MLYNEADSNILHSRNNSPVFLTVVSEMELVVRGGKFLRVSDSNASEISFFEELMDIFSDTLAMWFVSGAMFNSCPAAVEKLQSVVIQPGADTEVRCQKRLLNVCQNVLDVRSRSFDVNLEERAFVSNGDESVQNVEGFSYNIPLPRSLMHECRAVIIKALSGRCLRYLPQLCLPPVLKSYILKME
jgi:hypothetical protein